MTGSSARNESKAQGNAREALIRARFRGLTEDGDYCA